MSVRLNQQNIIICKFTQNIVDVGNVRISHSPSVNAFKYVYGFSQLKLRLGGDRVCSDHITLRSTMQM